MNPYNNNHILRPKKNTTLCVHMITSTCRKCSSGSLDIGHNFYISFSIQYHLVCYYKFRHTYAPPFLEQVIIYLYHLNCVLVTILPPRDTKWGMGWVLQGLPHITTKLGSHVCLVKYVEVKKEVFKKGKNLINLVSKFVGVFMRNVT